MHIVHARWTCRHAREARQAPVDMFHHIAGRRLVLLEHLLDQVDASARRIELVPKKHIGRARGRAKSAMHASAQDFLRRCDLWVEQLGECKRRLHGYAPAHMRPGLRTPFGSKLSFTRLPRARTAGSSGAKTSTDARTAAGARTSVAWPP